MRGLEAERWTPETFRHLDVPGPSVRLHVVRGGSGPSLVLLAGWPQTWLAWRHVLVPLSRDFDVLAIELRGQGHSEIVEGPYDTATAAGDLRAVLDWFGIAQAYVVGHDVGAWVATTMLRDHTDRMLGLGVLDAAVPGLVSHEFFSPINAAKVWQFYFHAQPELAAELVSGKEEIYLNWYFSHKCTTRNAIPPEIVDAYVCAYSRPRAMWAGFRWYADLTETMKATQFPSEFHTALPTFALGGENATRDLLERSLRPYCSDLAAEIIKGCGHYIPEERPETVTAWVRQRFLRD